MGMTKIDEDELNATRAQAAEALPWKEEAYRLAEALYHQRPNHPLLSGETWRPMVERFEQRQREGQGFEPDVEAMSRIAESQQP